MFSIPAALLRFFGVQHGGEEEVREDAASQSKAVDEDAYSDIEPLTGFHWDKAKPTIFHPYKAPYNLAFGMETIKTSDLIIIDDTYMSNLEKRKRLLGQYPDLLLGATDGASLCVEEMFAWMTRTYLPRRFPAIFELRPGPKSGGQPTHIANLVDDTIYELETSSPVEMLRIMGSLVDEDLLFMLPSSSGVEYSLVAFVNCFANGSHTRRRLNMNLRDIHSPVPGYREHLADRLDRWFEKLAVGRIVLRSNWAITDSNEMFVPTGHTPFKTDHSSEGTIHGSQLFVRSERQTLRRLPKSQAIVFSLKTYLYPVADIKKAGYGDDLVKAIDGLKDGNAPGMVTYKKSDVWGESVKSYLCS